MHLPHRKNEETPSDPPCMLQGLSPDMRQSPEPDSPLFFFPQHGPGKNKVPTHLQHHPHLQLEHSYWAEPLGHPSLEDLWAWPQTPVVTPTADTLQPWLLAQEFEKLGFCSSPIRSGEKTSEQWKNKAKNVSKSSEIQIHALQECSLRWSTLPRVWGWGSLASDGGVWEQN